MSVQGLIKSIKSLEKQLSAPLFSLDVNGLLVPTAYGEELYSFATATNKSLALLKDSFERIKAREQHTVRFGACIGIVGLLGPAFFKTLKKEHPELIVEYVEHNDLNCDNGLKLGVFDLAFTLAPYEASFTTIELFKDSFIFWIQREDPLAKKTDGLHAADLDGRDIAIPGKDFKCYDSILVECMNQGYKPTSVFQTSEMFYIFQFVMSGQGIGMGIKSLAKVGILHEDAVTSIPYLDAEWRFGLSYLQSHMLTEAEKKFLAFCLEYVPEHLN